MTERGLVVLDVTASDEETVTAVMESLQQMWATSGVTRVWRTPGEPGVRARVYAGPAPSTSSQGARTAVNSPVPAFPFPHAWRSSGARIATSRRRPPHSSYCRKVFGEPYRTHHRTRFCRARARGPGHAEPGRLNHRRPDAHAGAAQRRRRRHP
ncbi:DUF6207 family protein [Streptomyces sp. NPDC006307]|uniref:DUF6207 family protein n=1 Tax=Streptomyces sp. NPDC006307 TaxID=3156748 RepID=UPI0033A1CCA7